ncbi:MAG TPA: S8 family serine peptidase [Blastocatellia bacterium]|nr:S8 family serine peptidase [Blastocatellia bacterium]
MSRLLRIALFLAIVAAATLLPTLFSSSSAASFAVHNVSVIVELRDEPAAIAIARAKKQGAPLADDQVQAYRDQLRTRQDQLLNALRSSGVTFELQSINIKGYDGNVAATVPLRYTLVYNGLTLNVPETAVPLIKGQPQVKAVHANGSLCLDLEKSVPYIRADQVYGNPPRLTQFDNLDTHGFEGEGVNIAVIDTGIDWTHEMFGGDPTPPRLAVAPTAAAVNTNQKVIYSLPMADIVTDGFGHGTHVASTAGGYLGFAPGADGLPNTADDKRLHGVAPQAKLMTYKVCSDVLSTAGAVGGPVGGCLTSNIVLALEDAVSPRTLNGLAKPVAHVINMSLGGGGGPDDPTSVAADNATLTGAIVVAAAGNSGPGEGTLGSPAAGRHVIAVAANTDPGSNANWSSDVLAASAVNPTTTGAVTPANNLPPAAGQRSQVILFPLAGTPAPPATALAQYFVYVQNGQTLDEWPTNVSGRIALVRLDNPRLPQTLFAQIANNGAAAGAVGVLFVSTTQNGTAVRSTIPAATILPDDAQYLVSLLPGGTATNGAMSSYPIRLNPFFGTVFVGQMADFSSRGPVQGYGQVKPDVSAPGVNVLAAMPPASVLGALAGGNYGAISGTSMATPHTTGAAALVRQAHPAWSPDYVRTALINTATNMRDAAGAPKSDGVGDDSIIAKGGGLIDVAHAIRTKALMGVSGDGIIEPTILGSHSYGEVPVVNNRVTSTQSTTVTIQDLSGQGGTYNLNVANNRDLQINGINVTVSAASVSVPPNGTATFNVNATFDGNLIRDPNFAEVNGTSVTFRPIQMQWYVTAQRTDGAESLRMPFYFKPVPSLPGASTSTTQTLTGTVTAGDLDNQTVAGVTYVDIPFQVSPTTTKVSAQLDFFQVVDGTVADLDFYLLDPEGNVVTSSTNPGGPEALSASVTRSGTYTYRVDGYLAANTDFTITSTQVQGNSLPPTLQTVASDYVDSQNRHVDFDGSFTLQWSPLGGEQGFEIEESANNGDWQILADVAGNVTSYAINGHPNGSYAYRVRALVPGQIGLFVTNPSNAIGVLVDQRIKQEITSLVQTAVSNVTLSGGVFQFDLSMTNKSSSVYVPLVEFKVVSISSGSGTVVAINADNGGSGTSTASAALYDYSHQLGSDEQFSPNEVSGAHTLRFRDNASELFTYTAIVTAYQQVGGSPGGPPPGGDSGGDASSGSSTTLQGLTSLMRFAVNPMTRSVTVSLVRINP